MPDLFLRFDMRAPAFGTERARLYREAIDLSAWADTQGFAAVRISEHHGVEDGYLPSPLTLAAAIASRTQKLRLSIAAVVLPFHPPLLLAEQIAVLDLISGGRLDLTLAAGYVPSELAMFGIDPKARGRLLEQKLAVMRQAWTGDWFEHEGRRVRITPPPLQRPHPPLSLGGSTLLAAKRAARLQCGFDTHLPDLYEAYRLEALAQGFTAAPWRTIGPTFLHVSRDPAAAWRKIAPHAMHETIAYGKWASETGLDSSYTEVSDADELWRRGHYAVVTPEQCLALARTVGPDGVLIFHPLMGGMDPDLSWESLELFVNEVLPQLN